MTVTKPTLVVADRGLMKDINVASAHFANQQFGSVLSTMQHVENQALRQPISIMGGVEAPSCSMDVSCNLGNATHFDVTDGSVGYSIWVELEPNTASNWYFVLPNVLIRNNDVSYSGVAIKLFHGVSIAWDGRMIRHGTSLTETNSKTNKCFGWFWAADLKGAKESLDGTPEEGNNEQQA